MLEVNYRANVSLVSAPRACVLWMSCLALLLPLAMLVSSSEARDIAPWQSTGEIEHLWGEVLGCHDPAAPSFSPSDGHAYDDSTSASSLSEPERRDYVDCSKRALRVATSRILVDTIENSLRQGGTDLFEQGFRLDSSLSWLLGESLRGEVDTVIPIAGMERRNGTGRALFFQPGLVFWEGRAEELRANTNLGVVYRAHATRDWIGGASLFFDYDFQREHKRLSVGVDAQSEHFYGGLNYYFPLGRKWRRGRVGYEERALEGLDLHLSLAWERWRLDGALGAWKFDGDLDGRGSGWRPSADVSVGYQIRPGVSLEAGYERHDDRSAGSNWNVGLAFRYSLPGLEGIGSNGANDVGAPDLWRVVEREKRILYEERLAQARPRATLQAIIPRVREGERATVQVVLSEAIEEDVTFSFVAASSSTADTDDYTLPSNITIPAGTLLVETNIEVHNDSESEPDEVLDLELVVERESFLLVARGNPHRAQIVIASSDNSVVGFMTASTPVSEGTEVDIPLALGEPAPSGGIILATFSDNMEDIIIDAEMRIDPGAQDGQYIHVVVRADGRPEDIEMARIVLAEPSGGLPEGWRLGRREHELMIMPNEIEVAFEHPASEVDEDVGVVNLFLVLNKSAPAGLVLDVSSSSERDAAPERTPLAIPEGETRVNLPVRIVDDNRGEGNEIVTIAISESSSASTPEGWRIGRQDTHDITIVDDDLGLGFARSSSEVRESDLTTSVEITMSDIGAPNGGISLAVSADGNEESDISFATLLPISNGENSKALTVAIAQNDGPEEAETIRLTLSGTLPEPWQYGQTTHDLTILPNELEVAFEESSSRIKENVGTVNLALMLNQPAPAGLVLAVSSNSSGDAVPISPTLMVPIGARRATIPVRVINDAIGELNKVVSINISPSSSTPLPEGWSIVDPDKHELILTDDDLVVGFENPSSEVRESDLSTNLRIALSQVGAPIGGMSLTVSADGNEDNDVSFTTLLPISHRDSERLLPVMLAQDGINEGIERVVVFTLSGTLPDSWRYGQSTHELKILPSDQTAMFAKAEETVDEDAGNVPFSVVLSADAPEGGVPLEVSIVSGNDDGDVTFAPQSFTIARGARRHDLAVTVNNDKLVEPEEIVTFRLSKQPGATFPDAWGGLGTIDTFELTISDDDASPDVTPETRPGTCDKYVGFSDAQGIPSTSVPSQLLKEGGRSVGAEARWEVWIKVLGDALGKLPAEGVEVRAVFVDNDGDDNDDVFVRWGAKFTPKNWHSRGIDLITFRDGIDEGAERVSVVLELVNPPSGWCADKQFGRLTWTIAANTR